MPAPVRRFIASHIVSVAQLEVLLLLRAAADKEWTAAEVARALVTQPEAADGWLEDLSQRGLAAESGGSYRYAPASKELDRTVDSLAESYATYRVAVLFLGFALGFAVFAVSRLILAILHEEDEGRIFVYGLRLVAFLLILAAIVDKNLRGPAPPRAEHNGRPEDAVRRVEAR